MDKDMTAECLWVNTLAALAEIGGREMQAKTCADCNVNCPYAVESNSE